MFSVAYILNMLTPAEVRECYAAFMQAPSQARYGRWLVKRWPILEKCLPEAIEALQQHPEWLALVDGLKPHQLSNDLDPAKVVNNLADELLDLDVTEVLAACATGDVEAIRKLPIEYKRLITGVKVFAGAENPTFEIMFYNKEKIIDQLIKVKPKVSVDLPQIKVVFDD